MPVSQVAGAASTTEELEVLVRLPRPLYEQVRELVEGEGSEPAGAGEIIVAALGQYVNQQHARPITAELDESDREALEGAERENAGSESEW